MACSSVGKVSSKYFFFLIKQQTVIKRNDSETAEWMVRRLLLDIQCYCTDVMVFVV